MPLDVAGDFPVFVLRDYALVADGERGGLIGPRGDMGWLCVPAWDSDAVCSVLIGGAGCYAVTPRDRYTWGGYYDRRSLIWNSRWVTTVGTIEHGCTRHRGVRGAGRMTAVDRQISACGGSFMWAGDVLAAAVYVRVGQSRRGRPKVVIEGPHHLQRHDLVEPPRRWARVGTAA
jgi:hypothetical protein